MPRRAPMLAALGGTALILFALALLLLTGRAGAASPHPWPPDQPKPATVIDPPFRPAQGVGVVTWQDGSNADRLLLYPATGPEALGIPLAEIDRPADGRVRIALPPTWGGEPIVALRIWVDEAGVTTWWDGGMVRIPPVYLPVIQGQP